MKLFTILFGLVLSVPRWGAFEESEFEKKIPENDHEEWMEDYFTFPFGR